MQERYYLLFGARGQPIKMHIPPGFKQKTYDSRISTSSYQTPNREKIKVCNLKGAISVQPRKIHNSLIFSKADSVV